MRAQKRPPESCQRGKKSVSDRPLAAESIILIEGGAAIGQRPRARSFIIDSDAAALLSTDSTHSYSVKRYRIIYLYI